MPRGVYIKTAKHKNAISAVLTGRTLSPEWKIAIKEGMNNPTVKIKMKKPRSEEGKKNMRKPKSLKHCINISIAKTGVHQSPAQIAVNSDAQKIAQNRPEVKAAKSVLESGDKHWNWQGGITSLYKLLRNYFKSRQWTKDVFTRDNFTCQKCGDNSGGNLEAHHKKPFKVILIENNITTYEEAINCLELWDINNGITLCKKCHNEERALTVKQIKKARKEMLLVA